MHRWADLIESEGETLARLEAVSSTRPIGQLIGGDVAVTADGATLFIADPGNFRVRAVNLASGLISTFAGTGAASYLGGGRPAGQTPLAQPSAVLATAQRSHLFLADEGNGVVYRTTLRF